MGPEPELTESTAWTGPIPPRDPGHICCSWLGLGIPPPPLSAPGGPAPPSPTLGHSAFAQGPQPVVNKQPGRHGRAPLGR